MTDVTLTRDLPPHKAGDKLTVDESAAETLRRTGYVDSTTPDGISYHDELANTDASNHGAVTSAPVVDGVPQAPEITGTAPAAEDDNKPGDGPLVGSFTTDETPTVDEPKTAPAKKTTARKR